MVGTGDFERAPRAAAVAVHRLRLNEIYGTGPSIFVFFDAAACEF
jgi:hypothetical protein